MAHKVFEGIQFMRDLRRAYEADSQEEAEAIKDQEVKDKVAVIANKFKSAGLAEYVDSINDMMKDPKGKLALELVAGTLSKDELEELGLAHVSFNLKKNEAQNVKYLHPTQNEIGFSNSLKFPISNKFDSMNNAIEGDSILINKTPIITCGGEFIIDGHHRWSQVACVEPNATMVALDLQITSGSKAGVKNFKDATMVLKTTQALIAAIAIKANKDSLPSANSSALENLYALSEKELFTKIHDFEGSHEGLDILSETDRVSKGDFNKEAVIAKLGDSVKENWEDNDSDTKAAVYLTVNCMNLPKPAEDATLRKYMPQTDGADQMEITMNDLQNAAKAGLNVKESKRRVGLRRLKTERVQGRRVTGRDFDKMCSTISGIEMDSIASMRKNLSSLEDLVNSKGGELRFELMDGMSGSPHYFECSLEDLLKRIDLGDDDYVSMDFIDGEDGDCYALVFHNYEDPDDEELCATVIGEFE